MPCSLRSGTPKTSGTRGETVPGIPPRPAPGGECAGTRGAAALGSLDPDPAYPREVLAMHELTCDHRWVTTEEDQDPPETTRQQCRRCGDIRHIRIVNGDIIQVNGITRAVLTWEDDGGCPE